MIEAILDGREIGGRAALHDALARSLALPGYYGRNLDALYDCLTEPGEEIRLCLRCPEALEEHLGRYYGVLLAVLDRAAAEGGRFRFRVEDSSGEQVHGEEGARPAGVDE